MNSIVAWWVKNPVAANLLMIICFVGGVMGYARMEQKMFPVVPVNGASVSMSWQGASPQDVEDQLILRIEEAVADLDGVKRMFSVAGDSYGSVNIEAREDIDMDKFVDEVKQRIDSINNFPRSAFRPQIQRWEGRNRYFGMSVYGDTDRRTIKRITDQLRDRIATIQGSELAEVQGTLSEEVAIEVSEEALRRYAMSFSEVANAVRASSLNSSGGQVRTETGTVAITARQLADTAEQFGDIIIRQSSDQGTIRVDDIAQVIDGFVDADLETNFNGQTSAYIMIPAPNRMQISQYTANLRAFIDEANDHSNHILPEGIQIAVLWDDSVAFDARMEMITSSALLGAVLVCIVLLLFLRPVVALWVTVGIITAFAGGMLILPYIGVSWNVLSTFAVLLVIGVIVDDAIVVGENIHKEVESGSSSGREAAIRGTQAVVKPVMFGVLTTILTFLPWAFLTGPIQAFTQQITYVVVAALIFSIIECMFILPAHLSHMKPQNFDGQTGFLMRTQRRIADSLIWFAQNLYKPVLEMALRFRYATVAFFFTLFALALQVVSVGLTPFTFFPEVEGDLIQVTIQLPQGTAWSRTQQVRDQLQYGYDRMVEETSEEYPDLPTGLMDGASIIASDSRIRAFIGIAPPEVRPETISSKVVSQRLSELVGPIDDAEEISFDYSFTDDDNGLSITLNHVDLSKLSEASDFVKEHLRVYGSVYHVTDNLNSAAEEIRVTLKPGAEALGVTLVDVTNQLRQAYFGEEVQRLPRNGEDVRVIVRLPTASRRDLDSINNLKIRTNSGVELPMTEVAEFEFVPGINRIRRRDRLRSVTVYADLVGQGQRRVVYEAMEKDFWPEFELRYPEIRRGNTGGSEDQDQFALEIGQFSIIALGMMYILLAIAFKSYSQPLLLMTALPFAYAGAVFGHWFTGTGMAMFSFFGIAAAGGVVINDNLVLLDYVNKRREDGVGAVQALVDAGVSRFRPILLTSVTTFVGIVPLLFERSVQAQFLQPMLVALASAVAFALFISLLMVPAMYAVGVEIGRIFNWMRTGEPFRRIGERYDGEVSESERASLGV